MRHKLASAVTYLTLGLWRVQPLAFACDGTVACLSHSLGPAGPEHATIKIAWDRVGRFVRSLSIDLGISRLRPRDVVDTAGKGRIAAVPSILTRPTLLDVPVLVLP